MDTQVCQVDEIELMSALSQLFILYSGGALKSSELLEELDGMTTAWRAGDPDFLAAILTKLERSY